MTEDFYEWYTKKVKAIHYISDYELENIQEKFNKTLTNSKE